MEKACEAEPERRAGGLGHAAVGLGGGEGSFQRQRTWVERSGVEPVSSLRAGGHGFPFHCCISTPRRCPWYVGHARYMWTPSEIQRKLNMGHDGVTAQ